MLKSIVAEVLEKYHHELALLERDTSSLKRLVDKDFVRIKYDDAVDILNSDKTAKVLDELIQQRKAEKEELIQEQDAIQKEHGSAKKWRKKQIEKRVIDIHTRVDQIEEDLRNIPRWKKSAQEFTWGSDFGGSDETVLTMQFDVPVMVTHWPAQIKAFYMKRDETDTYALGVDILAPEGYGEIVGGSQREDNLDVILARIEEEGLNPEVFDWYIDLRRFGSVPHAGFGLGLERTVAWICGLSHVRETIAFPRMMGRITP